MEAADAILQKAPPADLEKNLKGITDLLKENPDAADALMKRYLLPFKVVDKKDDDAEKPFLVCRYNTVGDKHRSPWTNRMYAKVGDGDEPGEPDDLRLFEAKMNDVWNAYMKLYYGSEAVGSVYLLDSDKGAFQGLFGISKKSSSGTWNSLHIVHVDDPEEETCNYRVESSILVTLVPEIASSETTTVDISATMSKDVSKTCKIQQTMLNTSHIENLGKMIEGNEIDLRSILEQVHVPKTQEILDSIQKRKSKQGVNPLMGMIMDSSVLKKKLANEKAGVKFDPAAASRQPHVASKPREKKPLPVNPMMGAILGSSVLKKKQQP